MTYIRIGSCVRTCSSIRIYVWAYATVCVVRCVRTHFTNRGMCQNVDNAVVSFLGAGFACPKTQSKLFSGERPPPYEPDDNIIHVLTTPSYTPSIMGIVYEDCYHYLLKLSPLLMKNLKRSKKLHQLFRKLHQLFQKLHQLF